MCYFGGWKSAKDHTNHTKKSEEKAFVKTGAYNLIHFIRINNLLRIHFVCSVCFVVTHLAFA